MATQGGEPEVARSWVIGGEEARELWLVVALWTRSGTKGSINFLATLRSKPQESPASVLQATYYKLAAGQGKFSVFNPVSSLDINLEQTAREMREKEHVYENKIFSACPVGSFVPTFI